jgi:DNA-binding Lrp family transcriptional regulator
MKNPFDPRAASLAEHLQEGIAIVERPYMELASRLGCDEATVLELAKGLVRDGYIRSLGAFADFERLGYQGMLLGLAVPEPLLFGSQGVASRLDGPEITHNYVRAHQVNMWATAVVTKAGAGVGVGASKTGVMERLRSCGVPFVALGTEARLKLRPVFHFEKARREGDFRPHTAPPHSGGLFGEGTGLEVLGRDAISGLAALRALQSDFPLIPRPFEPAARALGCSVNHLLELLRSLERLGVLRRIGASLHHRRVGYAANALVAWLPHEKDDVYAAGRLASSFPWVSHCYIRRIIESTLPFDWPYTLYTMLHAGDEIALAARLREMESALSPQCKVVMPTVMELKKVRPLIS